MSPRGVPFEGESRARNYLQTPVLRAQQAQIKNPAGTARYIRELFGGDGSKTGVGVVETPSGEVRKHERAGRGRSKIEGGGASLPRGGENARKKCSNVRRRAGGRLLPLHEYE